MSILLPTLATRGDAGKEAMESFGAGPPPTPQRAPTAERLPAVADPGMRARVAR